MMEDVGLQDLTPLMMDRRAFLGGSIAWLGAPVGAGAQPAGGVPTVGILFPSSPVSDIKSR